MDDDASSARQQSPTQAGTVEPANRAGIAKELFQTPIDMPAERYELRDPFAEVTYRSNTIAEITDKADKLGASRFTAIDAEGKRTTVQRSEGEWQRGAQRPAAPERPLDPLPARDEVPDVAGAASGAGVASKSASRSEPITPVRSGDVDGVDIARLDAQAERAALVARLESALVERYLIKRAPVTVGDVTIGRTE